MNEYPEMKTRRPDHPTKDARGDMRFAAYFRDTEGNAIGLWQA